MFKYLLAVSAFFASSVGFATSTYSCVGAPISSEPEPLTVSWNVGTVSSLPSQIMVGGRGGVLPFDRNSAERTIEGFWHTQKRIWIHVALDSKSYLVLKAVNDGTNKYVGEALFAGKKKVSVTCSERG